MAGVAAAQGLTGVDLVEWGVVPASELGERAEPSMLPGGGLPQDATVTGSCSLLLGLLAEATARGLWAVAVGLPDLGLLAAAELGVDLDRLALVPQVGEAPGKLLAAATDGIDLIAAVPEEPLRRRISTRVRNRGMLLVDGNWPAPNLTLAARPAAWYGLHGGHGYLSSDQLEIQVGSKRAWRRHRFEVSAGPSTSTGNVELALAAVRPG